MSCHHNEAIQENILMSVLDMNESDIIEELTPALVESKGLKHRISYTRNQMHLTYIEKNKRNKC